MRAEIDGSNLVEGNDHPYLLRSIRRHLFTLSVYCLNLSFSALTLLDKYAFVHNIINEIIPYSCPTKKISQNNNKSVINRKGWLVE